MNCPACKTPGAYVGFTASECVNPACVHYKAPAEEALHADFSDAAEGATKLLLDELKEAGFIGTPMSLEMKRAAVDVDQFYEKHHGPWSPPQCQITLRQMPKPCCGFVEVYISHQTDKPSYKEWVCKCRKCGQAVSSPVVASEENMAREMNVVANFVIEKWNGMPHNPPPASEEHGHNRMRVFNGLKWMETLK